MLCPNCAHDNIPGADLCERCGTDLAGLDLPEAHPGFRGRLMTDCVGDLSLISPPPVLRPDATAGEAIAVMRQLRHGCVLVQDAGELVGIFTERDVLCRVIRPGHEPDQLTMSAVMTPRPIVLEPADPPAHAIHLSVNRGLRHIPVVDGSEVRGLLSVRQLLRHIHDKVLGEA